MTLFWIVGGWLGGIIAGAAGLLTVRQWLLLGAVCLAALFLLRRYSSQRLLFGILLAGCLGAARTAFQPLPSGDEVAAYNDSGLSLELEGQVTAFPEPRDRYTGLTVEIERLRTVGGPWNRLDGRLLARVPPYGEWGYGDRIRMTGRLETPPEFEGFSYRRYLARRGIHSVMAVDRATRLETGGGNPLLRGIYRLRSLGLDSVHRLFPEPEASLLAGILLGVESGIPDEVRRAFDATGTTHIIAISGFNITIVAGLFLRTLGRWLGARRGVPAAAIAIAVYTVLVGADAAVVRAALMAGLSLGAQMLGRRPHGYPSLAASAWAMTAAHPHLLWDVGFQLSFAATLGLLVYGERFQRGFERWATGRLHLSKQWLARLKGPITEYLLLTLAAQLTTLPLMLLHFGRLSLISPVANLLILPAQPAVMILGGMAVVLGMVWLPLAVPLAWIAWPFPAFTIRAVETLAQWPGASLSFPPLSWVALPPLYGLIGLATFHRALSHRQPRRAPFGRIPPALALGALGVATILAWRTALARPDGQLHITLLPVSEGQGVLLQTPRGRHVLVDGGASSVQLGSALDRRLPPFDRTLDWVIVTEADEESIGGLSRLVERYQVGGALLTGSPGGAAYRQLTAELQGLGRPVGPVSPAMTLNLGDGASLQFVELNEGGMALWLRYERFQVLLVPSAGAGWLQSLPSQVRAGQLTGVLPPQGGDAVLSAPMDLLALEPQMILLSISPGNRRGLPPRSLLEAAQGRLILRTDRHGWIELITDGRRLWVDVERVPEPSPLGG